LYVLRRSDLEAVRATVVKYRWECPYCKRRIEDYSDSRVLALAKIHLERKHGLEVRFE
jgi:PHP family Zn ribbon phosphoesterase